MLSGEHTEWAEFSPDEVLDVIPWPEQRVALKKLLEKLGYGVGQFEKDDGEMKYSDKIHTIDNRTEEKESKEERG